MVEIYESEQEQIDAIKRWWEENGRSVIIGIVLGIGVLLAYNGWQRYIANRDEGASTAFYQVSAALHAKQYQQVVASAQQLVDDYSSTHYASLAQLAAARALVAEHDNAGALARLQWVSENAKAQGLAAIATLRSARLLIASGKLPEAASILQGKFSQAYAAEVAELRGDLDVANKQFDSARKHYLQAQQLRATNNSNSGSGAAVLQLKIDDLGPASSEAK